MIFVVLGKQLFCRVFDGMHSANIFALGKFVVSGSGCGSITVVPREVSRVPTPASCAAEGTMLMMQLSICVRVWVLNFAQQEAMKEREGASIPAVVGFGHR